MKQFGNEYQANFSPGRPFFIISLREFYFLLSFVQIIFFFFSLFPQFTFVSKCKVKNHVIPPLVKIAEIQRFISFIRSQVRRQSRKLMNERRTNVSD